MTVVPGRSNVPMAQNVPTPSKIYDLASYPRAFALQALEKMERLERKIFPRREAFDFSPALLNKANTTILFMSVSDSFKDRIIAYAVMARAWGTLLLHKLCVVSEFQSQGLGKAMVSFAIQRARQGRCRSVELCVDPARQTAHRLYQSAGFVESEMIPDYYSEGRDGIKMTLSIDG